MDRTAIVLIRAGDGILRVFVGHISVRFVVAAIVRASIRVSDAVVISAFIRAASVLVLDATITRATIATLGDFVDRVCIAFLYEKVCGVAFCAVDFTGQSSVHVSNAVGRVSFRVSGVVASRADMSVLYAAADVRREAVAATINDE
jgi:hypothetical protein